MAELVHEHGEPLVGEAVCQRRINELIGHVAVSVFDIRRLGV